MIKMLQRAMLYFVESAKITKYHPRNTGKCHPKCFKMTNIITKIIITNFENLHEWDKQEIGGLRGKKW